MYWYTSADCTGLPHSSHSITVSGRLGSRMVFSASTKGTSAMMPRKADGARFAAAGDEPVGGGPAFGGQVLGAGHEVRERVPLRQELAVLIPVAAQHAAAADVGDGI